MAMSASSLTTAISFHRRRPHLASPHLRNRLLSAASLVIAGLVVFVCVDQSRKLRQEWEANRDIRALAAGERVAIEQDTPAHVLFAAANGSLARGEFEEAEALGSRFGSSDDPAIEAAYRFNLANARMRVAFDLIAANDIDAATVTIRLAQDDYRRAMRLVPEDFDFKFNFDVASRLVRVFPRPVIEPEDEGERPRDIWTDLPGVPRGLP